MLSEYGESCYKGRELDFGPHRGVLLLGKNCCAGIWRVCLKHGSTVLVNLRVGVVCGLWFAVLSVVLSGGARLPQDSGNSSSEGCWVQLASFPP